MGHITNDLIGSYWRVRAYTEELCRYLTAEDQCIQSMPDASPAKWHRAHTTWFFEQFLLVPHLDGYQLFNSNFNYLFNSYYESLGERQPRFARGLITRPCAAEVTGYRKHVDAAMTQLLQADPGLANLVELGLQHEQQHQELLLTDALHAMSQNPIVHAIIPGWSGPVGGSAKGIVEFAEQITSIGHDGSGFGFDNEGPRHRVLLQPYGIARHLVTNGEWLNFMADGGYARPSLWMSDGWAAVKDQGWVSPLYWRQPSDDWMLYGPEGLTALDRDAPVRHVSWYEADAFARWSDARLPTEAEWEAASSHPELTGLSDQVWQWTGSAYLPYPGFRAAEGAIGEYNGKFMINQMVLRGGSAATPPGHTRATYRNFFNPDRRWQFAGLRLAYDLTDPHV